MKQDIHLVGFIFGKAGFDPTEKADKGHPVAYELRCRNNPDGSVRWLWSKGCRRPYFLKFYNNNTLKSGLLSRLLEILFALGAGRLFAQGSMRLFMTPGDIVTLENTWGKEFAIFTGTPGPNRKVVLWRRQGASGVFVKWALNKTSATILQQEARILGQLPAYDFDTLQFPRLADKDPYSLTVTDIADLASSRVDHFTRVHAQALGELQYNTSQTIRIRDTTWWGRTLRDLSVLSTMEDPRLPKGLIRKLQCLSDGIDPEQLITCVMAHGDFTPWNMFVSGKKVQAYDWELSFPDAPLYWDAFHFIFQSGILLRGKTMRGILKEVAGLDQFEAFQTDYRGGSGEPCFDGSVQPVTLPFQLSLYLLINCTYYLSLYARQPVWHRQVNWLLTGWSEALNEVLRDADLASFRQLLCMDIFDHLQGEPYTVLKWTGGLPEDIPVESDIDLCVDRDILPALERLIRHHAFVNSFDGKKRSFMRNYSIRLKDDSLLSIDVIWKFMRKDIRMLDAARLLDSRRMDGNGVQKASIEMDGRYTCLFYLLNGASIPERYRHHLTEADLQLAYEYNVTVHHSVVKKLKSQMANRSWRGFLNKMSYGADTFLDLFHGKGMVITFSGVDGAGKSTVIEHIRQLVEKQFRKKVVVLRHRPSLLPILSAWKHGKAEAEQKAARTLPRLGGNRNVLSSLIRFAYYYVDYFVGQFYIRIRYVNRGYVVLYDRYYFDFINDSRRSNIRLSPRFTRWFYRFLLKPDLNFFLYASAEEILLRKQELDAATINSLTETYTLLFQGLSTKYRHSKYILIDNRRMADTVTTIVEQVKMLAS